MIYAIGAGAISAMVIIVLHYSDYKVVTGGRRGYQILNLPKLSLLVTDDVLSALYGVIVL